MAKLIITQSGRDKIYDILDDEITIGAGADADLVLEDSQLSAHHLNLKKVPTGYRIVDLETKHGTRVGGRVINNHVLANGDTIEIGELVLTYVGPGPVRPDIDDEPSQVERGNRRPITSRPIKRRAGFGDAIGAFGRTTILLTLVALGGIIAYAVYKQTNGLSSVVRERREAARAAVDDVTARSLATAIEKVDAADRVATTEADKLEIASLKKRLAIFQDALTLTERTSEARRLLSRIETFKSVGTDRELEHAALAREYLANFDDLELPEELEVRRLIAEIERSPRSADAAITQILREADEYASAREYRKAIAILDRTELPVRAAFADDLRRATEKIENGSRITATEKIRTINALLRSGDRESADREVVGMLEKLVWSSMDEIIASSERDPSAAESSDAIRLLKSALRARRGH